MECVSEKTKAWGREALTGAGCEQEPREPLTDCPDQLETLWLPFSLSLLPLRFSFCCLLGMNQRNWGPGSKEKTRILTATTADKGVSPHPSTQPSEPTQPRETGWADHW